MDVIVVCSIFILSIVRLPAYSEEGPKVAGVSRKTVTFCFKDSHRGKVPSNETPALTKRRNMGIWVVSTLNQLFVRGS